MAEQNFPDNTIYNRPDLADWLNGQLAQHESCYHTEPPVRDDGGKTAAPFLGPVFTTPQQRSLLNHREMKNPAHPALRTILLGL